MLVPLQTSAFLAKGTRKTVLECSTSFNNSNTQLDSTATDASRMSPFISTVLRHKGIDASLNNASPHEEFSEALESKMRDDLNRLSWSKVLVKFPPQNNWFLPLSHNRICALSRNQVASWIFRDGQSVMDFAAVTLLDEIANSTESAVSASSADSKL